MVTDRDHEPGSLDGGLQARRTLGIGDRERFLGQERDPALRQTFADRHGPVRWHRHVHDVGSRPVEHRVDVVEVLTAPPGGHRPGGLGRPRHHPDELRPAEPLGGFQVQAADPAATDQAQPQRHPSPPKIRASRNGAVSSSWS